LQSGNNAPSAIESPPTSPSGPPRDNIFLSVPGNQSRGNSLDHSPSSDGGDTLVPPRTGNTAEEEDPLKPDPGNEKEFQVEDNKFAFSPGQLGKLINPKNLSALRALGGITGLEKGLRTDLKAGLSVDETTLDGQVTFEDATGVLDRNAVTIDPPEPGKPAAARDDSFKDRVRVFKDNRLPERKSKSLLQLMWIALMDKVLLLLSAAAVISLALGLYQTFGIKRLPGEGPSVEWVEGVAIIVAVLIVVVVGAGNDYQKEKQFVNLNKKVHIAT
jgi:Ca2+-transporting ATPase